MVSDGLKWSLTNGTLLSCLQLADEASDETMATALLRCLFRNLMFYQSSGDHALEQV